MIKLAIIRFEGVKDPEELQVYLDNKLVTRTRVTDDLTVSLKGNGYLKISVKPYLKPLLYSMFDLKLLPSEGFQWIPLTYNPLCGIEEFPEDVCDPKVLVMVSNEFDDSIIEECETCILLKEENKKLHQDLNKMLKEIKEAKDIKDSKSLQPIQANPENFESILSENDKNKSLIKKFSTMYVDLKKEFDLIRVKYEEEHKRANDLNDKVRNLALMLEENSLKAKMREEFLEGLLNDREKEYKKFNKSENLTNTLPSGTFSLETLQNTSNLKEIQEKNPSNSRKILTEITNTPNNPNLSKETEIAIKRFLAKTSRKGLFTKDQGNLYKFGKKKVFVTLRHGQLLCRVGGGFEGIEEFILKNQDNKVLPICEKTHKRHKTFDLTEEQVRTTPEIEKIIKSRMRPLSSYIPDYT